MPLQGRTLYKKAEAVTDTNTTHTGADAVMFGGAAAEQFDLYIDGAWVNVGTLQPGYIYPISATGARDSGDAAPSAGEITFLR